MIFYTLRRWLRLWSGIAEVGLQDERSTEDGLGAVPERVRTAACGEDAVRTRMDWRGGWPGKEQAVVEGGVPTAAGRGVVMLSIF